MKNAVWLSDIHLNFLSADISQRFIASLQKIPAESIWISGDIGESDTIVEYLEKLSRDLQTPIYFVLGNHDYYRSSIEEVRSRIQNLNKNSQNLVWLNDTDVLEISPDIGLLGHDSWADGGLGDYFNSNLIMSDFFLIEDFSPFEVKSIKIDQALRNTTELFELILGNKTKQKRLALMQKLAHEAADHFKKYLPSALKQYQQIYLLTHIPPFQKACWHKGKPTDDFGLPYFACKTVGDTLIDIMKQHPKSKLTVLCGHTHERIEINILDNLKVLTAQADYGRSEIQKTFLIPD